MKKKNGLVKRLAVGALGTVMSVVPVALQAQYKTEAPIKEKPVVSSNFVPVKSLTKKFDYSTLKPVQELQETVVNYVTPEEGFSKGLTYATEDNHFYDERSSEIINGYVMEMDGGFYGDIYLDPFAQAHIRGNFVEHTDGDGTGDVNQSGITNRDDLPLVLGSNQEEANVDRLNGSGTQGDYDALEGKLKNNVPYIEFNYELLKTEAEKTSAVDHFLALDNTQNMPFGDCNEFAFNSQLVGIGVSNIAGAPINHDIYDTINNGKFDIPVYQVSTEYMNGDAHRINAVLVGTNPLEFTDWYFYEPQTAQRQYGGDASLNDYANIKRYVYYWSGFLGQFVYEDAPLVNFDLDANGQPIGQGTPQHSDMVTQRKPKFMQWHIGGHTEGNDTILDYPSTYRGEVVGAEDWATTHSEIESSMQTNGDWDYTKYNFDEYSKFYATSDSSIWIDTVYTSLDSFYAMPSHVTHVQDTTKPVFTYTYNGTPMLYTEWFNNGIPLSEGNDNCGVFATDRIQLSGQGPPGTCSFYEFTDEKRDSLYDPSHNWRIADISTPVEMNPNYWSYFTPNWTLYYENEAIPANTGGLPVGDNEIPEIEVFTNQNPQMVNSTYNPDSLSYNHYNWEFDWAHEANDTLCYDVIDGLQHVNVYKPNALTWTNPETIQDTFYIGKDDIVHPSYIYEPEYQDSLETWWPTYYAYTQNLIAVTPTDSIFRLDFTGHEDITNTSFDGPDYVVKKARHVGIDENGLEKRTKDIFVPYPNPTHSGKINVKINSNSENLGKIYWEAYDMQGRLVDFSKEEILPNMNEFEIDPGGWEQGEYLLLFLHADKVIQSAKLIVS